ncbi:MAG: ribose 5-phosphate isomerase B [Oligoflexia bacterium]|jgi:ribose 5-phosphate isomerase B
MKNPTSNVYIASDHAGVALKAAIQKLLPNYAWQDLGPIQNSDGSERVDYPDVAEGVAEKIASEGNQARGILICGSGIGMSISANKVPGIRAALVENPVAARLSREHNDANVLCLGSRFVAPEYGAEIAKIWLETPFSGENRHEQRVKKITRIEKKNGSEK